MRPLLLALALGLFGGPALAEVRLFETGSLATIKAAHEGRPFILALWSIDCTHCPQELQTLGELRRRNPQVAVVLVSTDAPDHASQLADFAASRGLSSAEQWVFADPQPQKLRYEIDRRWWGELPRTYLFDGDHKAAAYSGPVDDDALQQWLAAQAAAGKGGRQPR